MVCKNMFLRCSSATMDVQIGDENDNVPKMDQKFLHANFRENIPLGTKLLKIFATDKDAPDGYGKLTFTVDGGNGVFKIDQTTGQLILAKELDFEQKKSYQVNYIIQFCQIKLKELS